jgi:hypothetical protein
MWGVREALFETIQSYWIESLRVAPRIRGYDLEFISNQRPCDSITVLRLLRNVAMWDAYRSGQFCHRSA